MPAPITSALQRLVTIEVCTVQPNVGCLCSFAKTPTLSCPEVRYPQGKQSPETTLETTLEIILKTSQETLLETNLKTSLKTGPEKSPERSPGTTIRVITVNNEQADKQGADLTRSIYSLTSKSQLSQSTTMSLQAPINIPKTTHPSTIKASPSPSPSSSP